MICTQPKATPNESVDSCPDVFKNQVGAGGMGLLSSLANVPALLCRVYRPLNA